MGRTKPGQEGVRIKLVFQVVAIDGQALRGAVRDTVLVSPTRALDAFDVAAEINPNA